MPKQYLMRTDLQDDLVIYIDNRPITLVHRGPVGSLPWRLFEAEADDGIQSDEAVITALKEQLDIPQAQPNETRRLTKRQ